MYCYQCGTQIADEAKFCSGCGRPIATAQPVARPQRNMATHINVLAWLFIGTGILYAMLGFGLVIAPTILRNISFHFPPDVPVDIIQLISSIAGMVGVVIIVIAGGTTAAGVGLLQYQTWGRTLALVMSAINLIKIPFGTALGIYGFWVLLSERGREYYEQQSAIVEGRAHA
jgi:hypothetical protein